MSAAPKIVRRALHGVLLLHKPLGLSSNQALQKAKFLLRALKAGHTGTLDPLASGLLPLCFGAATKFGQWQLEADKTYIAHMKLGQTTTTGDAEGELLAQRPVPPEVLQPGALAHVAARFCGEQMQTPPMHSALKKDGKPLYEYARAGVEVPRAARRITIHALEFLASNVNPLPLRVRCSKGTYIRTLVGDMGAALGCGAHLAALQRTHSGPFALERAISLEALEALPEAQRAAQLLPPEALLADVPRIFLDAADAGRFLTGLRRTLPAEVPDCAAVAVFGRDPDAFLGLAHIAQGSLVPERLLNPLEIQQTLQQEFSPKACPT